MYSCGSCIMQLDYVGESLLLPLPCTRTPHPPVPAICTNKVSSNMLCCALQLARC